MDLWSCFSYQLRIEGGAIETQCDMVPPTAMIGTIAGLRMKGSSIGHELSEKKRFSTTGHSSKPTGTSFGVLFPAVERFKLMEARTRRLAWCLHQSPQPWTTYAPPPGAQQRQPPVIPKRLPSARNIK